MQLFTTDESEWCMVWKPNAYNKWVCIMRKSIGEISAQAVELELAGLGKKPNLNDQPQQAAEVVLDKVVREVSNMDEF